MMLRILGLITSLALAVAGGALEPATTPPERMPELVSVTLPPPECITKSIHNPPSLPSWAFIVNFEVISGSAPLGCLAVFNASPPDVYFPIPCHAIGAVTYFHGFGLFQGGRVECPINLRTYLTSPPISNTQDTLMMQGVGRLSPTEVSTSPYRSPIVFYTPTLAATGTGLFLRAAISGSLQVGAFLTAVKDGFYEKSLAHPFTTTLANSRAQTWRSTYWKMRVAGGTFASVQNLINGADWEIIPAGTQVPISFRADGGTFIVGGSPLGPNLRGTLDEIIVDPAGGHEPPISDIEVPLNLSLVFLPTAGR